MDSGERRSFQPGRQLRRSVDIPRGGQRGIESVEAGVLTATRINIRSAPNAKAGILAQQSFGILKMIYSKNKTNGWTKVPLPMKRIGYVNERLIRAVTDYRATFAKINGRWMISRYVAGDWSVNPL